MEVYMDQVNMKGQGLVEYALILVLIALVVIVALELFGISVTGLFSDVNDVLDSVSFGVVRLL
jgi:pilus assembly protein Flp/PilA